MEKNNLLVSSGTWTNGNLNVADTEYASTDSWTTFMNGYNISPYFLGAGEFDLLVDSTFVNWGSFNKANTYSSLYTGKGTPASFLVFDGDSNSGPNAIVPSWYGDNHGNLDVKIYSCNPNAPTLPTNKDQCKNNGWKNFGGIFKNQGDCVSFVATGGKNPPANQ